MQVLRGDCEVGRVELDDSVHFAHYGVDAGFERNALEIQFIEVSKQCRRQGIGTEIIRRLEADHPSRTLVAFSEEADEFWTSLRWRRYYHPTEPQFYRTLFIRHV
ncbi:GNAT family N-acetyltransferase [Mycobacterium sp. IS-1590]|uniref:GNAT family N-acetyltransferase n=1 Tax=Mycobacterium sp. IS-1590 TaxID=1772286 RepID=UPI0018D22CDF